MDLRCLKVECVTSWCRLQTASRWCGLFDSDLGGVVPCGFVGALPVERWCLYRRNLVTFGSRSIFRLEDGCSRFVAGGVVLVILWRPRSGFGLEFELRFWGDLVESSIGVALLNTVIDLVYV
ncbi:hypothetical protein Droror1_Dr00027919 [Drosera rotundifolia]